MGVMECSRKDCPEIMCRTYVPDAGHVCGECKSEFEDSIKEKFEEAELTQGTIRTAFIEFMSTSKYNGNDADVITVSDFFNKHS